LNNLSTGLKTVLNILYLKQNNQARVVDITECGDNALNAVFEIMNGYEGDIKLLLYHAATYKCNDYIYRINDEYIVNSASKLSDKLMEVL
jgi:hypothetical protein